MKETTEAEGQGAQMTEAWACVHEAWVHVLEAPAAAELLAWVLMKAPPGKTHGHMHMATSAPTTQ